MLKLGFEYSFYIYSHRIFGKMKNDDCFLWFIFICNDVIQTLWFLNRLIRYYQGVFRFVLTVSSTSYGGSHSSACSLKALICWGKPFH